MFGSSVPVLTQDMLQCACSSAVLSCSEIPASKNDNHQSRNVCHMPTKILTMQSRYKSFIGGLQSKCQNKRTRLLLSFCGTVLLYIKWISATEHGIKSQLSRSTIFNCMQMLVWSTLSPSQGIFTSSSQFTIQISMKDTGHTNIEPSLLSANCFCSEFFWVNSMRFLRPPHSYS